MTNVGRGIFLLLAGFVSFAGSLESATRGLVPFAFHADFQLGFSGWMSFPLPQDLGFDPDLSVEKSASGWELIHAVTPAGQKRLTLGFSRPIHFIASPEMSVRLNYRIELSAAAVHLRLVLSSKDGRRYEVDLPAGAGQHQVALSGRQLNFGDKGVPVEAIVIEGVLDAPQASVPDRIVLRAFDVTAFRFPEVPVLSPSLSSENSDGDIVVASRPLSQGEPLTLELGAHSSLTIKLTNPQGHSESEKNLTSSSEPSTFTLPLGVGAHGLWTADIRSKDSHTRFSFIVLARAAPHPRTLLSAQRLQALKTGAGFAKIRQQIHNQAHAQMTQIATNGFAGANILRLSPGKSLHAEYDGELTPYFQLLDSYSNTVASCSLDYALNGDQISLDIAKRNLLAVAQWSTWTPPRFSSHGMHTYYEVGVFAQKVAFGYDLIAAQLSQSEKDQIANAFWTNIIKPTVDEYFRFNRMPLAASNWMANSVGGALMAAVVTEGDISGWHDREGIAVSQLAVAYVRNLRALFPDDGSELEPIGYQHFAMEGFSWGAVALASLQVHPAELARLFSAFNFPSYAMIRPDLLLDGGDFDGGLKSFDGFAYAAEHADLPGLREFYDQRPKRDPSLLDLVCCTREPWSGFDAPPARLFEGRGSVVIRSGWDPKATVISLRAGPWFNHEHHDQGSFQVAAFGDSIISEAGYANYYRDPNYPTYFTQAPGHNTVLLDEDPFSQADSAGNFWRGLGDHLPRIVEHLFSGQMDYVSAALAGAYDDRLSTFTRKFLFISPDVLIISDEISAPQPHAFHWLLHPAAGTIPSVSGNRVRIETASAVTDVLASEGTTPWEMKPSPLPISAFQDLNHGKIEDRYVLQLQSARSRETRFTVALQFHPRGVAPESFLLPSALPGGTGFAGSQWTALFRSGPAPLRVANFETDAQIFATRRTGDFTNWIAAGATVVKRGMDRLISASTGLLVAYTESAGEIRFDLCAAATTNVEIHLPVDSRAFFIDDAQTRIKGKHTMVQSLAKGEHHVRIFTGSSL